MSPNFLYIEDHPDNMTLVKRIFRPDGYNLIEAESGLQGVSIAEEQDINLPDIDGYEVARRLRTSRKVDLAQTPIVAVTANAMKGDANKVNAAGCNVYMSKPISIQALMDTIENLLPTRGTRN